MFSVLIRHICRLSIFSLSIVLFTSCSGGSGSSDSDNSQPQGTDGEFSSADSGLLKSLKTIAGTITDDAYLENGKRVNNSELRVENASDRKRISYLKFNVSDLSSGSLQSAALNLVVGSDPGKGTFEVYSGQSNSWTEDNLSTSTAPKKGKLLHTLNGSYSSGQTLSFNVASAISGNGTYTFILETLAGGNDLSFISSEGAQQPRLYLSLDQGSLSLDQCDYTAQCVNLYGSSATDCLNSQSDKSVCMCGTKACSEQTSTTPSSNTTTTTTSTTTTTIPKTSSDQCDSTSECKSKYGTIATDCLNSTKDNSVCMCGSTACDDYKTPSDPTPTDPDPTPPSSSKPRIWVTSDITDSNASGHTDLDDIVTMSGLLLLANQYQITGIVVGAIHVSSCTTGITQANKMASAYIKEVSRLNSKYGGYPTSLPFKQASTCRKLYNGSGDISNLPTVQALVAEARKGSLFILNWGPMTESAFAVKHLLDRGEFSTLKNMQIISHWTRPVDAFNCREDSAACDFLHNQAAKRVINLYELGQAGQNGMVNDNCNHGDSLSRTVMLKSQIGAFMDVKWNGDGMPDMSDGSTYLFLSGYGGGLSSLTADGVNNYPNSGTRLCRDRSKIFDLLESRARTASGG